MIRHLGYACTPLDAAASSNRTCRLANATPERLRGLIAENLDGLLAILRYNAGLGVRLFRISSHVIPFASHPANTVPWWREFAAQLGEIGAYARDHGMRLSFHPGQHTALTSPRPEVLAAGVSELTYNARFLAACALGPECKVILHGGGTHGDKPGAIARFAEQHAALPEEIVRHLVLENDERCYSAADVLEMSRRTGVPVVFDALHDAILPSPHLASRAALLAACFATWRPQDGVPKTHFSSQDPAKQSGAHAEWVDAADFARFAADTGAREFDCMLEAKGKERALLRLRQELAGLQPVTSKEGVSSPPL
jgi:UV DNA damage endonuclease